MNVLVIGSSGAIGNAIARQMYKAFPQATVYAVSRQAQENDDGQANLK